MRTVIFSCYTLLTFIFIVLTCLELIEYFKFESNFLGLLYLLLNFFIIFIMISVVINFGRANYKIRISKNIIIIIVGVISSFLLGYFIPVVLDYTDKSFLFVKEIYIYSKILKPIIYVILGLCSIFEIAYKKELFKRFL